MIKVFLNNSKEEYICICCLMLQIKIRGTIPLILLLELFILLEHFLCIHSHSSTLYISLSSVFTLPHSLTPSWLSSPSLTLLLHVLSLHPPSLSYSPFPLLLYCSRFKYFPYFFIFIAKCEINKNLVRHDSFMKQVGFRLNFLTWT